MYRRLLAQCGPEVALGVAQEAAGQAHGVEVVVGALVEAVVVELVDAGLRAGQQDRRVGGDDELRAGARGAGDRGQRGQAARDRQRGLGLVEDVEALTGEAVRGERQERLAVRLLVELEAAVERQVGRELALFVHIGGDVEEALGAQEIAVARLAPAVHARREALDRARDRRQLAPALVLASLGREADRLGDRLDQRRLARAVVAREQRDRRAEIERRERAHRGHAEREPVGGGLALEAQEVRARAGTADVPAPGHQLRRTTILPVFAPASRSMNACGAASMPPSTTVSRYFSSPLATQPPTSCAKARKRSKWSTMM